MISFIYMKILESQPHRYDKGISYLSLGASSKVLLEIADTVIHDGDRVLDIGTGTGALALLAAARGAEVVGMDASAAMLAVAEEKRTTAENGDRVTFIEASVGEMDRALNGQSFDAVTASLVFSELSEDEQRYTLSQAYGLLRPGGHLVIADEKRPDGVFRRFAYELVHIPLALITFAVTQTSTRPVSGVEKKVSEAGFRVESIVQRSMGSYFVLYAIKK